MIIGLVVLCFAEAGSRVSMTGGPYAYVETALGPFIGFVAGILLFVTGLAAGAAVATIFAGSVMKLIPIATCLAIVWLFYETAGPHELFALALAVLVAVILYGIRRYRLRR